MTQIIYTMPNYLDSLSRRLMITNGIDQKNKTYLITGINGGKLVITVNDKKIETVGVNDADIYIIKFSIQKQLVDSSWVNQHRPTKIKYKVEPLADRIMCKSNEHPTKIFIHKIFNELYLYPPTSNHIYRVEDSDNRRYAISYNDPLIIDGNKKFNTLKLKLYKPVYNSKFEVIQRVLDANIDLDYDMDTKTVIITKNLLKKNINIFNYRYSTVINSVLFKSSNVGTIRVV